MILLNSLKRKWYWALVIAGSAILSTGNATPGLKRALNSPIQDTGGSMWFETGD